MCLVVFVISAVGSGGWIQEDFWGLVDSRSSLLSSLVNYKVSGAEAGEWGSLNLKNNACGFSTGLHMQVNISRHPLTHVHAPLQVWTGPDSSHECGESRMTRALFVVLWLHSPVLPRCEETVVLCQFYCFWQLFLRKYTFEQQTTSNVSSKFRSHLQQVLKSVIQNSGRCPGILNTHGAIMAPGRTFVS